MTTRTRTGLLATFAATFFACSALEAQAGEAAPAADPTQCAVPAYRRAWELNDESGQVELAFQRDAQGKVKAVKLVASSGWADLDSASVRALKHCVFKGAAIGTQPDAPGWESVRYDWVLKEHAT